MISSIEETFLKIPLSEIGQSYARLRLIHPQGDSRMVDSIREFFQIFAVMAAKRERYELTDGFKRIRALKRLSHERGMVRVLELGVAETCHDGSGGRSTSIESTVGRAGQRRWGSAAGGDCVAGQPIWMVRVSAYHGPFAKR
jgi:hypothetical protein